MAEVISKSFEKPDDVVEFPYIRSRIVELGDLTVGELVSEPGRRCPEHVTFDGPARALHSDLTRALAGAAGLRFEDRGVHTLEGIDGEWRLAAYVSS